MDSKKDNVTNSKSLIKRISRFLNRDIWEVSRSELSGAKAFFVNLLRIVVTTVSGIVNKRILVQASSLSYATLLAIGPILAITVIFSGIFFRDKGENFIYGKIMDAAVFVMPAFNEMMDKSGNDAPAQASLRKVEANISAKSAKINPRISKFIDNVLRGSASAGTIGMLTMLLTCVLLCKNMESAFNYIWGVTKGRAWITQVVFYFTLIFFGSVGLIFGMTFFATSHLAAYVKDIPFVSHYAPWITYILGLLVMSSVLASFYKFIPYTKVKWRAAFIGALVITLLLVLNNKLSFLYISYIVKQQNFYGYLAIVAVAMFSLYIFWTMILTGGQIAYAVQYVDFLADENAWLKMGGRTKRLCALAVFAEISRAFCDSRTHSPRMDELIKTLNLPKSVVSACIDWLVSKDLACVVEDELSDGYYFKPSIPPDSLTLSDFFERLCVNDGDADIARRLEKIDPIVAAAATSIREFSDSALASKKLKEILNGLV